MNGDIKTEVVKIKNKGGKDIWLFGGAIFTTTLMNLKLVDELHLAVHPILLGGGKPLFHAITERITFETDRHQRLLKRTGFFNVRY